MTDHNWSSSSFAPASESPRAEQENEPNNIFSSPSDAVIYNAHTGIDEQASAPASVEDDDPPCTSDTDMCSPSASSDDCLPTCRICLAEDDLSRLIRPCRCDGSARWVHRDCLDAWRAASSKAFYRCDVCQMRFKLLRERESDHSRPTALRVATLVARDVLPYALLLLACVLACAWYVNDVDRWVNLPVREYLVFPYEYEPISRQQIIAEDTRARTRDARRRARMRGLPVDMVDVSSRRRGRGSRNTYGYGYTRSFTGTPQGMFGNWQFNVFPGGMIFPGGAFFGIGGGPIGLGLGALGLLSPLLGMLGPFLAGPATDVGGAWGSVSTGYMGGGPSSPYEYGDNGNGRERARAERQRRQARGARQGAGVGETPGSAEGGEVAVDVVENEADGTGSATATPRRRHTQSRVDDSLPPKRTADGWITGNIRARKRAQDSGRRISHARASRSALRSSHTSLRRRNGRITVTTSPITEDVADDVADDLNIAERPLVDLLGRGITAHAPTGLPREWLRPGSGWAPLQDVLSRARVSPRATRRMAVRRGPARVSGGAPVRSPQARLRVGTDDRGSSVAANDAPAMIATATSTGTPATVTGSSDSVSGMNSRDTAVSTSTPASTSTTTSAPSASASLVCPVEGLPVRVYWVAMQLCLGAVGAFSTAAYMLRLILRPLVPRLADWLPHAPIAPFFLPLGLLSSSAMLFFLLNGATAVAVLFTRAGQQGMAQRRAEAARDDVAANVVCDRRDEVL